MTDFERAVRAVLAKLPPGDTYSYGWVAEEAGYPGRAR
ncbi:MAG: MGMT family protein, partial [Acidimicrobiia bacterium]